MAKRLYTDHLHRVVQATGRHALKPDFDFESHRHRPVVKRGPSRWLEVKDDPDAYKVFDFKIMDGNVFMSASIAGREWMYYVLPEGLDAYSDLDGWIGYRITNGLDVVLDAALRDGLVNEADALSENDALMTQWENSNET